MPKSENQKLKTLFVARYFMEYSDENHAVTASDICDYLENEYGIHAERRSIYRDIAALRDVLGMEIEGSQGGKYRLISHSFEFNNLLILAECVRAAKFISENKSKEIIDELSSLYEAEQLSAEAFLVNRVKSTQRGTLNILNTINTAMAKKESGKPHTPQKISFKYLKYDIKNIGTITERRRGEPYIVSPYKLLINEGNYYLLAFDDKYQKMRTYRIDRMREVKVMPEPRDGAKAFEEIDMTTYTQRVFGMFTGNLQMVSIRFTIDLLDTVIDKFGFGHDTIYRPEDRNHFVVTTNVEVSHSFFAWLCGFGIKAKIMQPKGLAKEYKNYLDRISNLYY